MQSKATVVGEFRAEVIRLAVYAEVLYCALIPALVSRVALQSFNEETCSQGAYVIPWDFYGESKPPP